MTGLPVRHSAQPARHGGGLGTRPEAEHSPSLTTRIIPARRITIWYGPDASDQYCLTMQDFKSLMVWQRARSLSVAVHEATRSIRRGDAPGLQSQLRRASMSVPATIAEGAGRSSRKDFARFIAMAIASASEVEHHLTHANDLGVLDRVVASQLIERVVEIRRMLFGLRRALLMKGDE